MTEERFAEIREEIEPRDIEEYAVARELADEVVRLRRRLALVDMAARKAHRVLRDVRPIYYDDRVRLELPAAVSLTDAIDLVSTLRNLLEGE